MVADLTDLGQTQDALAGADAIVHFAAIPAPGLRLLLLMIFFLMALTADTRIASAAPGGADPNVAPPANADRIDPGPAP